MRVAAPPRVIAHRADHEYGSFNGTGARRTRATRRGPGYGKVFRQLPYASRFSLISDFRELNIRKLSAFFLCRTGDAASQPEVARLARRSSAYAPRRLPR